MNKYEGKKVAILRGYPRLIDGESTSVEEMYNWGKKNNVEFHSFYYHKPWKRKIPTYKDDYIHEYTIFNRDTIEETIKTINDNYDLVILINPAKPHSGLGKVDVIEFHKMYKKISTVKVFMQHNHFEKAVNEMPFCWSYLNESDAAFNLTDGWFIHDVINKLPSKKTRSFLYHLWSDVNSYKDFYKNEDRDKKLTFIGRFVMYKGPIKLLNIGPAVYENAGLRPEIYGMDTSIGCKTQVLDHPNANDFVRNKPCENPNPVVNVYKKLERNQVLKKFNKSMFAFVVLNYPKTIAKELYSKNMEYAFQEAILAGSVLVVNKEWAEGCRTSNGVRYIDIPNFAIPLDLNNPHEAIKKMKEVSQDENLQKTYRDTAFEILRSEYDNSVVLPKLMNRLFSIYKDPYKFSNDFELVKFLTQSEEKAQKFIELYEDGNLLPMTPRTISKNKISIYGGKSGKKLVEYADESTLSYNSYD